MSSLAEQRSRGDLPTNMSVDEFFDWLETHEDRYELDDGTPVMMPFVKRAHARVVSNFDRLLHAALDPDDYMVTQGDFAVQTGPRSIRFADVLVEPASDDLDGRIANAILIVEVLSESTAKIDFGAKRLEYLGLDHLQAYVIAAQDEAHLWVWQRAGAGWPEAPQELTSGEVAIAALGVTLPLSELYRGVRRTEP
ncbi:Uma2 family endonuclease [Jiella sonneratiae]|uniref:Uma2 family endonuclease n=1 Tax=Jiella sonneratiae TaxID=2816856 RepID=A0ABS3IXA3_9HYPH|nr:Uma2 family endonuclease [Jiella sonneratiae]MBO0902044.1 Uma2 family endonuclease [Jiella sonneratiae]